jgi:opacity protein-like surface antigen
LSFLVARPNASVDCTPVLKIVGARLAQTAFDRARRANGGTRVSINDRVRLFIRILAAFVLASVVQTGYAAAQPGAAQTTTTISPGHWTATPFVGFGFSGDLDSATGDFGVAGGYVWDPRLSFEGELSFLPSSENSGLIEVKTHVTTLAANVLYHFAGRKFVPYAVAGIGFAHAGADVNSTSPLVASVSTSSNHFIANIGGGAERLIRGNTAVRGDFRYMFGSNLVPDYWRLTAGVTFGFHAR